MNVLIIDDNQDITDAVSLYLTSHDITCDVTNQGQEGLELLNSKNFDLILLDIAMPDFSGMDIINSLSEHNSIKSKKIVVLTASNLDESTSDTIKTLGVKDVIKKPLSVDELHQLIDKYR